jgi:2-C-methyl-D-erythritol 4-phosphate cytidylyltransferase
VESLVRHSIEPQHGLDPSDSHVRHSIEPEIWAIVVAGGSGARFGGDVPKQYLQLNGTRILDRSLAAMRAACGNQVVLVVPADRVSDPEPLATVVVAGGTTRSGSVRAGLAAVPESAKWVLVHDAARPLVPTTVVESLLAALQAGADASIPGVALSDTVKRVSGDVVVETIPRETLVAVQTPQAFVADRLRAAHAGSPDATDDAALIEQIGGRVVVVPGSVLLRKVTSADDLAVLERMC